MRTNAMLIENRVVPLGVRCRPNLLGYIRSIFRCRGVACTHNWGRWTRDGTSDEAGNAKSGIEVLASAVAIDKRVHTFLSAMLFTGTTNDRRGVPAGDSAIKPIQRNNEK